MIRRATLAGSALALLTTLLCTVALLFVTAHLPTAAKPARPAAAGDLDPSFGTGGVVTTTFRGATGSLGYDMATQADGKYVVVGLAALPSGLDSSNFALTRFNPDGSVDTGFGNAGQVTTDFAGFFDRATAVAIQTDGKILVVGTITLAPIQHNSWGTETLALARYLSDGRLDLSYGQNGKVLTPPAYYSALRGARALILQTNGKAVVCNGESLMGFYVDGSIDPTYGINGVVNLGFYVYREAGHILALQPDGKILVLGSTYFGGDTGDFVLARYQTDGSLDPDFGQVTTHFDSQTSSGSLALSADGRIVIAGFTQADSYGLNARIAVARYTANGILDTSFGTGGMVTTNLSGARPEIRGVLVQSDNRVLLAGLAGTDCLYICNATKLALLRYTATGQPDPTFGSNGQVISDFDSSEATGAFSVLFQPDGKLLVDGFSSAIGSSFYIPYAPSHKIMLARYQSNGTLDTTFGNQGRVLYQLQVGAATVAALGVQPSGKIIAAGSAVPGTFALTRYAADGSLDATFGNNGRVTTVFGNNNELASAAALVIQPDGKIVAAGTSAPFLYPVHAVVARYLPDGALDQTFGSGGRLAITDKLAIYALAVQPNGKIVAAGVADGDHALITRYLI